MEQRLSNDLILVIEKLVNEFGFAIKFFNEETKEYYYAKLSYEDIRKLSIMLSKIII